MLNEYTFSLKISFYIIKDSTFKNILISWNGSCFYYCDGISDLNLKKIAFIVKNIRPSNLPLNLWFWLYEW